jgi:cell division protein FtsL
VATPTARRRRLPFLILSALLVSVLVVGVVSVQAFVAQTSFKIQELTDRTQALRQSYGDLRLEVARLSAPGRIANEAHRLGMRLPADVQSVQVSEPAGPPPGPGRRGDSFALKGLIGEHP